MVNRRLKSLLKKGKQKKEDGEEEMGRWGNGEDDVSIRKKSKGRLDIHHRSQRNCTYYSTNSMLGGPKLHAQVHFHIFY